MSERRMFTQKIVDSDAFLDMPLSAQCLYFHLNMRADDDGFVNNPKKIQRMLGATEDDLKLLLAKRFIIGFASGVIVIKHWRMHNLLRKDRYNPTQYREEYKTLELKENGSYTERGNQLATSWQPNGNQMAPQDSIGKDSIVEDNTVSSIEDGRERPKKTISFLVSLFSDEFEEVWKMYPKKQGKSEALKAYAKARNDGTSKEDIVSGLKKYISYTQGRETRYIKNGSTWFNQKGWQDEYEEETGMSTQGFDYDHLQELAFRKSLEI